MPSADGGRPAIDAKGLEATIARSVRGTVRFDAGFRALYATDGSNYRQPPIGVVVPKDVADVEATLAACRQFGAPVLSRGCGTSLAGQCCNVAVVMDMSMHMNRILALDPVAKTARVQPGVILDNLRAAAERHHLTFAPDPATHTHNTLGGMIGNNSCGVHSMMGGRTVDNVHELEVLTYDGLRIRVGPTDEAALQGIIAGGDRRAEIYRELKTIRDLYAGRIREHYPDIPRRVSGYNLDDLLPEKGFHVARALVGSEATCVAVLEATVRLVDSPPARVLLVLGYADVYQAGDHIADLRQYGPVGLEGIDAGLVGDMRRAAMNTDNLRLLPDGGGWLLCEFGGDTPDAAEANARRAMNALKRGRQPPTMVLYSDRRQKAVWEIRESGLGATAHVPGKLDTWPGWEDSAVPPERVGEYLRALKRLFDRHGYEADLYGHFGQGCIHTRIDFDLGTKAGIARYRRFAEEAADLIVGMGGSFSGEHGDGQARGELLERMYGPELMQAMRRFKRAWDPLGRMNPGKVIDPYRLDENLRIGTDYAPPPLKTVFAFPADGGDFAKAALRCVGVAKCRREQGGTMCPSFMATREEMHSTRGRARLLFEMVRGDVITKGWREPAVKEALDLCLACKGCKGDCPVQVDMATYKAEFNHHYYRHRLRPREHYAFGLIDVWARWGARAPWLANAVNHAPAIGRLVKWAAKVAPERTIPRLAPRTFRRIARGHESANRQGREVILWVDTFNNHFHPETLAAALEVLEAAGFRVKLPRRRLCCGRPLYDIGMLPRAKRLLARTLRALHDDIRAGVPVVGLEPACVATFRDELLNLFPHDQQAQRLGRQTFLLGEFLAEHADGYRPPPLHRQAKLHLHCNHKAILRPEADSRLLEQMGMECEVLDSGCCGMAGAFGFDRDKYGVSMACGERVLLPAVRNAGRDTLIISDGYSCREQIAQGTGVRALHLAEVLQMALHKGLKV
jgi:FAD/FMN-containing dehydrogenase/Fe-S oxidoreductase